MNWTEWLNRLDIDRSPGNLRKFGIILSVLIIILFLMFSWKESRIHWSGLIAALVIVVVSLVIPRAVQIIFVPWMILARAVGFVITQLLLSIIFYVIFTPVGLVMRLVGRDPLRLKRKGSTYWIERDPGDRTDYERMF